MTDKVNARITVKVITGETFRTAWTKETPEAREKVQGFLSRVSDMSKFDITTSKGLKVYINPAHIVYSYVETE